MAKVDKTKYTKDEWRRLKEQRRLEKQHKREHSELSQPPLVNQSAKRYILCLKHGTKYDSSYVNKLYNMVERNCSLDYEFVCLTDDSAGIDPRVKILNLPGGISGWWCKPYMFSKHLPINGTVLYVDLDVVIANNIDKLFQYSPGHWCTVRDFTRAMRPKWHKYNSSVVRFQSGQLHHVWEEFEKDKNNIQKRYHGDQDWLFAATRRQQAVLFPDSWILSWKWEVRKSKEFAPGGVRGKRKFRIIEDVEPRVECCIAVFHGDPNPAHCEDPWVVENWQ